MVSRTVRTPFGDWWWTVDRAVLAAMFGLMLGGIILSLAASPPVAARLNLDAFHFVNRHVLFLAPTIVYTNFQGLANSSAVLTPQNLIGG
jgi:cell division protein FtsW